MTRQKQAGLRILVVVVVRRRSMMQETQQMLEDTKARINADQEAAHKENEELLQKTKIALKHAQELEERAQQSSTLKEKLKDLKSVVVEQENKNNSKQKILSLKTLNLPWLYRQAQQIQTQMSNEKQFETTSNIKTKCHKKNNFKNITRKTA